MPKGEARTPQKSVAKSKPVPPAPFKPGDDPRRGRGPAKGAPNAGRPPNEWKQSLRGLADREAVLAHVDAALTAGPRRPKLDESGAETIETYIDAKGRPAIRTVMEGSHLFEWALEYATEHGYGRAAQSIDMTSEGKALTGVVVLPSTTE